MRAYIQAGAVEPAEDGISAVEATLRSKYLPVGTFRLFIYDPV